MDTFIEAATTGRRQRAEELLAAQPELERDPWAALVLGRGWKGDPNAPGGPLGWAPILYVSHSVFADADLARELLARGADANASSEEEWGRSTALYGAAGVVHDPELTRVLLAAGADPDDGESLYHSTEADDPACLRLLLEAGAQTRGTNALPRALDFEHLEHVRMLLDAGADPNESPTLAHAVRRGRGPEFLRLLVEHGAEVDRVEGTRTAYALAVVHGRVDCAEALAELGASTELDPADAPFAAIVRGENPGPLPPQLDRDQQESLIRSALRGRLDLVVDLVGPNWSGVADGSPEGTLLHHAAWYGNGEAARTLLARGADPQALTDADFETPLAWAVLASRQHEGLGLDHVSVAEALVEHGARIEPQFLEVAAGPLRDWLQLAHPEL